MAAAHRVRLAVSLLGQGGHAQSLVRRVSSAATCDTPPPAPPGPSALSATSASSALTPTALTAPPPAPPAPAPPAPAVPAAPVAPAALAAPTAPAAPTGKRAGFVPRPHFTPPASIPTSYFLGHHKAGLQKMKELVNSVELIIECRDYRVPLSSRNPLFEETLQAKQRLLVYTKRDLGMEALDEPTKDIMTRWHHPHTVMFSDTTDKRDIRKIVAYTLKVARNHESIIGTRALIVGMPNVGKSTLLNALRRLGTGKTTKAAITGGQPGVTRKLSGTVRISADAGPLVYVIDTPGVFVPYMPNANTMLKLALVGCIKDSLIPPVTLADCLLFHLNRVDPRLYAAWCAPTNDVAVWLAAVARKTGKLLRGGDCDLHAAALWLVARYRKGLLGRFILDDVKEGSLDEWLRGDGQPGESATQARKRFKKERAENKKAAATAAQAAQAA